MTMIAHDPYMGPVPGSLCLCILSNCGDSIVDDLINLLDIGAFMSFGVRRLVDPRERSKHKRGIVLANSLDHFSRNRAVDLEPALNPAREMSSRSARNESGASSYNVSRAKTATDHVECSETRRRKLEYRRSFGIDIRIDMLYLEPHVAARISGKPARSTETVVPPQPWQSDRTRIPAHDEGSVRGSCHRGKNR